MTSGTSPDSRCSTRLRDDNARPAFSEGADEELVSRMLPRPEPGDLLAIRDARAYGSAMSSNYNSIGRAPQVWAEPDGTVEIISRRETIDDILKAETSERLAL